MRLFPLLAPLLAATAAGALEPLNPPVPLAAASAPASAGESSLALASAQRAQALGFASTAVALYRSMLGQPGADLGRLTLDLSGALLDDGDVAGAGKVLDAYTGARGAGWHIRAGLVAAESQKFDQARSELAACRFEDLEPAERGWHLFLQALLADATNEPVRASGLYQQAANAAVSDLQRARFLLAEEQVRLRHGGVTETQVDLDRKNAAAYQGQKIGYGFTREYAVALNALGRRQQAVDVLQGALRTLPAEERAEIDHFRLLLGLVAGSSSAVGRHELFELLASGSDVDRQRVALELLLRNSESGPQRVELGERLDRLIGEPHPHPILESLLICRAELGLAQAHLGLGDSASLHARSEDDARALLEKFPGSPLKAHAYAVLAGSAWEQHRYRTAADYASKAAAELPAGQVRSEFAVLVAEAWYRAGDYRNAADAYAAALRAPPQNVAPCILMFQRVQSAIGANALSNAVSVLDEMSPNPAFDAEDRWQAEWNLARSLEAHGRTAEAYVRVNRVLSGSSAGLPQELKARMAWLQARLSFDAGKPEETLRLVDALAASASGLPASLGDDIAGTGLLLRAQANFALARDGDAGQALQKLRADFPRSDSAVYSYIVEADRYAQQDKVIDAQRLLTKLADDFPASPYAPYALYQAALQAERLGADANLKEAYKLLENLVTNPAYARSDLIFAARMRQGDLLRELNQFPQAQQMYELLVNNAVPSQGSEAASDVILAQLALAECHNAQSANDTSHADSAKRIFRDLVERVDAPPDVRVEAGYNLGKILSRADPDKAQAVWWSDVIDAFLTKPGASDALGPKGRWWLARTLLDAGLLYEKQGRVEEAKHAWTLVLSSGLPGQDSAKEQLARFNLPAAKP